jgi:hypothetical protein
MSPKAVEGRCIFQKINDKGFSECNLWYGGKQLNKIAEEVIDKDKGCAIANGNFWNIFSEEAQNLKPISF